MKIAAWRLFKERHRATAFTGEGARLYGGRWNKIGVAVIYASESRSLALLETLVHLEQRSALEHFLICEICIDSDLVERLEEAGCPNDWNRDPPSKATQSIGTRWVAEARSAALMVPSVLVAGEHNLLLNPYHTDFSRIEIGEPEPFDVNPRLRHSQGP